MKQLLITIAAVMLVGTAFADPILIASRDGDLASVQAELDKGVDVNTKAITGVTSLHVAAGRGHTEIVELLITEGADVNAKDDRGWTPLFEAVNNGHKEIVELLIANGADVNAKHKTKFHFTKNQTTLYINNPTPLDWANISKQTEIADLLRKRGGKKSEVFEAEGN